MESCCVESENAQGMKQRKTKWKATVVEEEKEVPVWIEVMGNSGTLHIHNGGDRGSPVLSQCTFHISSQTMFLLCPSISAPRRCFCCTSQTVFLLYPSLHISSQTVFWLWPSISAPRQRFCSHIVHRLRASGGTICHLRKVMYIFIRLTASWISYVNRPISPILLVNGCCFQLNSTNCVSCIIASSSPKSKLWNFSNFYHTILLIIYLSIWGTAHLLRSDLWIKESKWLDLRSLPCLWMRPLLPPLGVNILWHRVLTRLW